jgi:CCR4-NOT transcription complex subunit 4
MALPSSDPEESFLSDEEEEFCPLCVEEMDISDRNFKPCPCGYQVCQFCYNNIRQNPQLNGKCPACRRPYDDESVEYRLITPEEWKREHAKQARRERERKQREREKKETELSSKKHLSGMRVIQKNLVYIIGLNPNIPIEELHHTLRTDQFFGQYGKIQKIVINRRNNNNGTPGLGVYVTFARKEDAARCIAAVDGMLMDGKYLRAAYGTTKYCSAYLRGQSCPNPNCMFLHEPGEEADSYSRHDLSTIQHVARQDSTNTKEKSSKPATKLYPSNTEQDNHNYPQHLNASHDHHDHNGRPSALPASVSWATKPSPSVSAVKISQPSFPPLPAAPKPAPAITPPPIVQQKPDLPIVVHREPPKPDQALKFMEDSLVMLCAPSFNYRLPQDMVKNKKLVEKRPLFAFSSTTTDSYNDLNQDFPSFLYTTYSPLFVYRPPPEPTPTQIPQDPAILSQHQTPHSLSPHHLQQLPPPPPAPLQNLHQHPPAPSLRQTIQPNVNQSLTQLLDKIDSMRMQTPPPPPPPGLYSAPTENLGHGSLGNNVPSQNSQELLARLMKRDPPGKFKHLSYPYIYYY